MKPWAQKGIVVHSWSARAAMPRRGVVAVGVVLVLRMLCAQPGRAQSVGTSRWQGQVEVGGWASSGQTMPFWLRANQFGIVPATIPAATLRAAIERTYRPVDTSATGRKRRFDWSTGVQAVGNAATSGQFLLPVAYGTLRWKSVELAVGRRRQLTGLGDSTLSSGFINGSGNAMPIPKVQIATPGYVLLGFRWLAVNAGFGHGWFVGAYIDGSYLHQKYLYLRLGNPAQRLKVYAGINHQVQWGGQADYLKNTPVAVNGKLPSQFKYYPYVVLGLRPSDWQNANYTSFDGTYWLGNGLGSIDAGLELAAPSGTWFLYHQHIYEDLSGLLWQNAPDGLTGLSWRRPPDNSKRWLNRVVVEYLYTMNQSGSTFDLTATYQGEDNYFNHSQYREGWSYLGRTIGTPFIMPQRDLQPGAKGSVFFPNNRLKMAYVGANGQVGEGLSWMLGLSYSHNYGTYTNPYPAALGQVSALAGIGWVMPRLTNTQLNASVAVDQGQLLPNAVGGWVGLRRNW